MQFLNWLPNGKSGDFYGITATYRKDKGSITEDLLMLFSLLKEGKINPIIYQKYPILDAAKANELLESGEVIGKIVLLAPDLMYHSGYASHLSARTHATVIGNKVQ